MRLHLVATACLSLTSCDFERPIKNNIHDNTNDVNLVIEHYEGPPLSQSEDKLYLITDDGRKLVFEGYGGSSLFLPPLKRGALVIAYCGGTIRRAESFLAKENAAGEVTTVKIQPVITSGIKINGKSVCKE